MYFHSDWNKLAWLYHTVALEKQLSRTFPFQIIFELLVFSHSQCRPFWQHYPVLPNGANWPSAKLALSNEIKRMRALSIECASKLWNQLIWAHNRDPELLILLLWWLKADSRTLKSKGKSETSNRSHNSIKLYLHAGSLTLTSIFFGKHTSQNILHDRNTAKPTQTMHFPLQLYVGLNDVG